MATVCGGDVLTRALYCTYMCTSSDSYASLVFALKTLCGVSVCLLFLGEFRYISSLCSRRVSLDSFLRVLHQD